MLDWTTDGAGLIVRVPLSAERVRLDHLSLGDGKRNTLTEVAAPEPGDTFRREFVVADNGRGFAFSFQRDLASLYLVRGIR